MDYKDKFQIYYWQDQLYVEFYDWTIEFNFNGNVVFDIDGEYYGPASYYRYLDLCSLVGFIELMKEWRNVCRE